MLGLSKKNQKRFKDYLTNKYLISLVAVIVWVLFFDKYDFFSQLELRSKQQQLQEEKSYFKLEIEKNKKDIHELKTNPENLEKFAREKYLMKKNNEDIYVIIKDTVAG